MIANEIIKTALLGTDKYMPAHSPYLTETEEKIAALQTDKEDRFLKLAITTLLYEESGRNPLIVEHTMAPCPAETLSLASKKICGMVYSALETKDEVLLLYLIHLVNKNNQVLASELIPMILDKALENKKTANLLIQSCGETGKWLGALNDNWRVFFQDSEEENVWETGSFESRKMFLKNLRGTEPARAVALLEVSIAAENAGNRLAFIEQLGEQLSLNDEPFLQNMLKDKSQKVKETATAFLRRLQGSAINTSYLHHILNVISVAEERHLLFAKKKVLKIKDDLCPDEMLFKTGIDKISADKGLTDNIYILGQMLRDIDPVLLAEHLQVTDEQLINLFLQHEEAKYLISFLAISATVFKNKAWARALLALPEINNISLLEALPKDERPAFYEQFIEGNLQQLLAYLLDDAYTVLPLSFSGSLLLHLWKSPYFITQPVYKRIALHLPDEILPELKKFAQDPGDDYQRRYFRTQVLEMIRIIDLKNNIN